MQIGRDVDGWANNPADAGRAQAAARAHLRMDQTAQVVVQSATWELHSDNGGGIVDQGSCVISEGNLLTFMLSAPAKGWYHLLLTCSIGPEIYKTTGRLIVRDCH